MPLVLGNHSTFAGAQDGGTTAAINTTGATMLTVTGAFLSSVSGIPGIVDSAGNGWTRLNHYTVSGSVGVSTWYVTNPITSATHTASLLGSFVYCPFSLIAWTGNRTASVVAGQNGNQASSNVASIQTGSVSPLEANTMYLCILGQNGTISGVGVDSGFTVLHSLPYGAGNNYGYYLGYLLQGAPAAVNPTWSWTTSQVAAAMTVGFREGANGSVSSLVGDSVLLESSLTQGIAR